MARTSTHLPERFPAGTTYVVEARGSVQGMTLMHRYVQFPDGRRIDLTARVVQTCEKSGVTSVKSARSSSRVRPPAADRVG